MNSTVSDSLGYRLLHRPEFRLQTCSGWQIGHPECVTCRTRLVAPSSTRLHESGDTCSLLRALQNLVLGMVVFGQGALSLDSGGPCGFGEFGGHPNHHAR